MWSTGRASSGHRHMKPTSNGAPHQPKPDERAGHNAAAAAVCIVFVTVAVAVAAIIAAGAWRLVTLIVGA